MKQKLANKWAWFAGETISLYDFNERAEQYHYDKFGEAMALISEFDPRANTCCGDMFDRMWVEVWLALHGRNAEPPSSEDQMQRAACFVAVGAVYPVLLTAWLGSTEERDRQLTQLSSPLTMGRDMRIVPKGVE